MNEMERALLATTLSGLAEAHAETGMLITLYVPRGTDMQRCIDLVKSECGLAGNIKHRQTRKSVEDNLASMLGVLRSRLSLAHPNGLALFAKDAETLAFLPPEPILSAHYYCDREFYLTPLKEMLVAKAVWGLVVVDRGEATIGWTDGRRIELLHNFESYIMPKHKKGGMSQARYGRMTENSVTEFFTKVGAAISADLLPFGNRLVGIIVGGPGFTHKDFVDRGLIDYRLRAKLLKVTFSTGYTDEQGLKELVAGASLAGVFA